MNSYMRYSKAPKTMPKKEASALLEELRELLSIAKMEHANFNSICEEIKFDPKNPDAYIKEKTRLYRDSYLVYPIEQLIKRYTESAAS